MLFCYYHKHSDMHMVITCHAHWENSPCNIIIIIIIMIIIWNQYTIQKYNVLHQTPLQPTQVVCNGRPVATYGRQLPPGTPTVWKALLYRLEYLCHKFKWSGLSSLLLLLLFLLFWQTSPVYIYFFTGNLFFQHYIL